MRAFLGVLSILLSLIRKYEYLMSVVPELILTGRYTVIQYKYVANHRINITQGIHSKVSSWRA
jgi:xanthine/uracil permease